MIVGCAAACSQTRSVAAGGQEHERQMRSRDKGSGDPSVRLIQKIGELIEKHTGMTPVLRS